MKGLPKLALLAALVGVLAWALRAPGPQTEAPSLSERSRPVLPTGAPAVEAPGSGRTDAERVPVEAREGQSPPVEQATEPARSTFEARVVDPDGTPLGGIRWVALDETEQTSSPSDRDGNLRLEYVWQNGSADRLELEVRGAGRAWQRTRIRSEDLHSSEPVFLGRIVLQLGGSLRGRVVDEQGTPLSDVLVYAAAPLAGCSEADLQAIRVAGRRGGWPGLVSPISPRTRTDTDGSYLLEGVPAVFVVVGAWQADAFHTFSRDLGVAANSLTQVRDLVLAPAADLDVIAGTVRRADGKPVPGARLYLHDEEKGGVATSLLSDARGAFRIPAVRHKAYRLEARDPEGRASRVSSGIVRCGELDVELHFRAADPIAGPSAPFKPPGENPIQLDSGDHLTGIVRSQGQALAGAKVHLHAAVNGELGRFGVGLFTRVEPKVILSVETDAEGRFRLPMDRAGRFEVHAQAKGLARQSSNPFDFAGASERSGITLDLVAPGSIAGRVLLAPGIDPSGVIVGASNGDGHLQIKRSDTQGLFMFSDLTPGGWQVLRCDAEAMRMLEDERIRRTRLPASNPWTVQVRSGETTRFDLDFRHEIPSRLLGRLLFGGRPPVGWSAAIPPKIPRRALDSEGRFSLTLNPDGPVQLWLTSAFAGGRRTSLRTTIEMKPGENPWELDLLVGCVELEGLPSLPELRSVDRMRPLALVSSPAQGVTWELSIYYSSRSEIRIENVPAGKCFVTRKPERGGGPLPESWPRLAEFELSAGENKRVEIND